MEKSTINKITDFYKVISDNSIIGAYMTKRTNVELYIKVYLIIVTLLNIFICAWALYTAMQCAEPICNFMVALCAPHVYVVYRMARPCLGKK
jgi:hypothetical protein